MSYGNTIAALSLPPGSPGSALQNPAVIGASALQSDPAIAGLRNLVEQQITESKAAMIQQRDVTDQAYDRISSRGIGFITPDQSAAYQQAAAALDANPTSEAAYAAFAAARQPIYEAGLPYSSAQERNAVADAEVLLGQANVEVSNAIQYKADVIPTLDAEVNKLVNGDPTATDDIEKVGIAGTVQTKLEDLSSDMAILSGGESAVQHIARVDGTAPETPSLTCQADSLIRRGLKAITDAGKLIADFGKRISSAISSILGPIKDWTTNMLKTVGNAIKGVISSIGAMAREALDTFKGWIDDAAKALKEAMTWAKNKAFLNFMDFADPCIKDSLKEVINMNNVDTEALEKARNTA